MTRKQAKVFRHLIDVLIGRLSDDDALDMLILFEPWEPDVFYEYGDRRRHGDQLYFCKNAHKSQSDWPPDLASSLWNLIHIEEWPEWYMKYGEGWPPNAKVTHNGQKWINELPIPNTWEPGVYGWRLYEEDDTNNT